jgi:serine protease
MFRNCFAAFALGAIAGAFLVTPAVAEEARLIMKLQPDGAKSGLTPKARIAKAADSAGVAVRHVRAMALGADVVAVVGDHVDAEQAALRLAASADVEFAEVDHRRHAWQTAPVNDIFAAKQHYLRNDPTAMSAFSAWDVTHGSSSIVVAVVDSGYRPHAAMAGRFLPGYDMVSDPPTANDGDGRDPDASDPGDWISATDAAGYFAGCDVTSSVWHGTGVAGIIGANTNDGIWTAGIDWNAQLLPVRVLGKCGGYDSDVADGIAWAAGLEVPACRPTRRLHR